MKNTKHKTKTTDKLFNKKKTDRINEAFKRMTDMLHSFRRICQTNGSPIKSVTYRVPPNGETRCHVDYA